MSHKVRTLSVISCQWLQTPSWQINDHHRKPVYRLNPRLLLPLITTLCVTARVVYIEMFCSFVMLVRATILGLVLRFFVGCLSFRSCCQISYQKVLEKPAVLLAIFLASGSFMN